MNDTISNGNRHILSAIINRLRNKRPSLKLIVNKIELARKFSDNKIRNKSNDLWHIKCTCALH